MHISRFVLLFGGLTRTGLHTLITENTLFFSDGSLLQRPLYTLCLERTVLATE